MDIYEITGSALTAQRLRLDTISSNLANVNTTRKQDGTLGAYKRKNVVFAPLLEKASQEMRGGRSFDDLPLKPSPHGFSAEDSGRTMLTARINHSDEAVVGVQVTGIEEDTKAPMRLVFDPGHPDANPDGYVELPNINVVTEMVDMISASRAYEANVTALQSAKHMDRAALEI
jgi:flagellar basal-body rod protein FlgC